MASSRGSKPSVSIELPIAPVPKGRPRRGAGGHWYTPERTRAYEEAVAWYCAAARIRTDELVDVRIVLHLKRLAGQFHPWEACRIFERTHDSSVVAVELRRMQREAQSQDTEQT